MQRVFLLSLLAVAICSCGSVAPPRDLSASAAERDAQRDIAAGRLQIYMAGGRASSAVGIPAGELHLVRELPRNTSLSLGCVDEHLREHIAYAEAYNRVVLHYVRTHRRNA